MLHRTARLTPDGRQLLIERILIEGRPAATAAEMLGVSRATAYKWLRRYRAEGAAGLEDRSARPRHQPRALTERQGRRILRARRRLRVGPHRLGAPAPPSALDGGRRPASPRRQPAGLGRSIDRNARVRVIA